MLLRLHVTSLFNVVVVVQNVELILILVLLQVKKLWGEDVMKHHNSWSHHNITWLFPGPEHHPLRKNFREKMHKEHEREMNMTDWNSDKVRFENEKCN